jgi:hypothetical protein
MTFSAVKDPQGVLDYLIDWEPFLSGDFIDSVLWIVPDGLVSEAETHDNTTATIWISGGVVGVCYDVTCRITTIGGRVDDRTIAVTVNNK